MPKRRAIRRECHIVPGERPAIAWDRLVEEPTSTAFFIRPGNKLAICGPVRRSGCPHGLRLGPNETIWAIALKLSAAPAIQKAIIGPGLRNHLMELRSEEHTSEFQSLMRISYAVFCLKNTNKKKHDKKYTSKNI